MSTRRRALRYLRFVLALLFGALLLGYALRGIDRAELLHLLREFPWILSLPVLALIVVSAMVRAYRWRLLFLDVDIKTTRLFLIENTGIGFNNLVPIRVLSQPIQFAYLVLMERLDQGTVVASLVLVRVFDIVVQMAIIALGLLVFQPHIPIGNEVWLALIGAGLFIVVVLSFSILLNRWNWIARRAFARTYTAAWRGLASRPKRTVWIAIMTALQWTTIGLAAWLIAQGLGIDLSFPVITIVTLATSTIGFNLPGLPGGIGPFQAAAITLLSFYAVPAELALSFGILIHLSIVLPPIAIAGLTMALLGPPWRAARTPQSDQASTQKQGDPDDEAAA